MNEEIKELQQEVAELNKTVDRLNWYCVHCTNIIQDIMDELRDLSKDDANLDKMDKYIMENL